MTEAAEWCDYAIWLTLDAIALFLPYFALFTAHFEFLLTTFIKTLTVAMGHVMVMIFPTDANGISYVCQRGVVARTLILTAFEPLCAPRP